MTSAESASPLVRKALRDGVYDRLLDMLLDGTLAPGESISIDGVSRSLGVSPTPVREALVHLERTGLVSRAAHRGYRVAPPLTAAQMHDLAEARIVVELGMLEPAFEHLESLIPSVREAHQEHQAVADELLAIPAAERSPADYRRYFDADWGFHAAIIQGTHNKYMVQLADSLGSHVHRLRQTVTMGVSDAQHALAEHEAVLGALGRGDLRETQEAMRVHLRNVERRSVADATSLT